MKKKLVTCIVFLIMVLNMAGVSYGAGDVVERTDFKVMIEGSLVKIQDPPIIAKGWMLLPLRALLNNLGVSDQNIKWNAKEKSVTFKKAASSEVFLKIGSNVATVDQIKLSLDTAPMIYKDRTYIPVRFVAGSLDKQVLWDEVLKVVHIRKTSDYNIIRSILDQAEKATKGIKGVKYEVKTHCTVYVNDNGRKTPVFWEDRRLHEIDYEKQIGKIKFISNSSFKSGEDSADLYFLKGKSAFKTSAQNTWLFEEFDMEYFQNEFKLVVDAGDALSYGLWAKENPSTNEIQMSGNTYLMQEAGGFLELFKGETDSKYIFKSAYTVANIDKSTKLLKNIHSDIKLDWVYEGEVLPMELKVDYIITEYNPTSPINVPQAVLSNL